MRGPANQTGTCQRLSFGNRPSGVWVGVGLGVCGCLLRMKFVLWRGKHAGCVDSVQDGRKRWGVSAR